MDKKRKKLVFRVLDEKDVDVFRELRLEAVQGHPESFLGDYGHESSQPIKYFKKIISNDKVVGCFRGDDLLGMAGYYVVTPEGKRQHSAKIWGFYIRPQYRGQGFARKMLARLIEEMPSHVEKLLLKVHARNRRAIRFYQKMGFEIYGLERKSLKIDDEYYDDYLMSRFLE